MQEHQLEAKQTQVELQRLVIEDLEQKLSDALALVDTLQVCIQALKFFGIVPFDGSVGGT